MKQLTPFHLAIPVENLERCRKFYCEELGCEEGRSSNKWVDLNFFGHQFVIHQVDGYKANLESDSNPVDGHNVPVPHFGVVLEWEDWTSLSERLIKLNTSFIIEPYIRFKDEPGEQATMFFHDPEGNALEFKAFKNIDQLFASEQPSRC